MGVAQALHWNAGVASGFAPPSRIDHVPPNVPRSSSCRSRVVSEETANSVTHGLGLVASAVAMPVMILAALARHDPWQVVAAVVFGTSLVLLYGASTCYHALPQCDAKRIFRLVDHSAIYVLIAGTYTPFALGVLRGPWGWSILGAVWSLAAFGIVLKCTRGFGPKWLSTAAYLAMGWLALVMIRPLYLRVGPGGLALLFAGGLCYTAGVVFFAKDTRLRFGHMVWHLFVLAGSAFHVLAVLRHAGGHTA